MPDTQRALITDLGHANRGKTGVIMTKGRDMSFRVGRMRAGMPFGAGLGGAGGEVRTWAFAAVSR
jgi:hypothetical protein